MLVYHKTNSLTSQSAYMIIQEMLDLMENSLIVSNEFDFQHSFDLDSDSVVNPGDELSINFLLSNNSFNADAFNINISVYSNNDLNAIQGSSFDINYLSQGSSVSLQSIFQIPENIHLGEFEIYLNFLQIISVRITYQKNMSELLVIPFPYPYISRVFL